MSFQWVSGTLPAPYPQGAYAALKLLHTIADFYGMDRHKDHPDVAPREIEFLGDVELGVSVEFGRTELTIKQILEMNRGAVYELNRLTDEPLCIRVNGTLVARGEIVVVNDSYGIRVTEVVEPEAVNTLLSNKDS